MKERNNQKLMILYFAAAKSGVVGAKDGIAVGICVGIIVGF